MDRPSDLDNLLRWLGPDPAIGAQRYLEVRKRLMVVFECRGCEDPGVLADETLDRTARAIVKPSFTFGGEPIAYLLGVARNVYLESRRRRLIRSQEVVPEIQDAAQLGQAESSETEVRFDCLEQCLAKLADDRRSLLLRYYQGQRSLKIDGRQQLAREKGLELNALRIQVFRLRNTVRQCVERCVKSREMAPLI